MELRSKTCFSCGGEGHIQRLCKNNNNNNRGYNNNNNQNQNQMNINNNTRRSGNYYNNNNQNNQRQGTRNNYNNNNNNYRSNYNGQYHNQQSVNTTGGYQQQQPQFVQISFDYLVAVDVEANCDEGPTPTVTRENQEIIELSWVVIDTQTLTIVNKKQIYVKPTENPVLSEFCTKQTGVTNEIIQTNSVGLASALSTFDEFLSTEFTSKGKTFCLITDGVVGIRHILLREAHRKGITISDHYYTFFDLKVEFNKLARYRAQRQQRGRFENFRPGLKQMRNYFGIPHQTQDGTGLDKALLVSKILIGILKNKRSKDDWYFRQPIVLNKDKYDPNAEDQDKSAEIIHAYGEGVVIPSKTETTILAMKGLPWSSTEQDVIHFFQQDSTVNPNTVSTSVEAQGETSTSSTPQEKPQEETTTTSATKESKGIADKIKGGMEGIHIVGDETGRPSGVCYVIFETHNDAKEALKYNKRYIGNRYIEVFLAMPTVLDDILDTNSSHQDTSPASEAASVSSEESTDNIPPSSTTDAEELP